MDDAKRNRLAELREKQAEREREAEAAAEERELQVLELTEKYEGLQGKRGVDFEIVNNPFGVFAVRKPDAKAQGNWQRQSDKGKLDPEWLRNIIRNYILPDKEEGLRWAALCGERPGLLFATAHVFFVQLQGIQDLDAQKK